LQQLNDYLKSKKLLLVLDNCEHLIGACAEIVNALLRNTLALTILATSREALGVPGELIWHVPSLSLPDGKQIGSVEGLSQYEAVQLFIERAILAQPHFHVTNENAPAIAQICFRLDGIPLAIELAAARVKMLGVDQIHKRLDDRFRLLTGGSRTVLERHQTLRAALDWSYNLLSDDEKLLLNRLTIFAGGWSLEAAEEVCEGNHEAASYDVVDLLTHLVDKSLVFLDGSRYNMLETTRQYAYEKLVESGELEWVQSSHLHFYMKLAEEAETKLYGPEQAYYLEQLETEQGNLRTALKWGLGNPTEAGFRLASALWIFWFMHAHFVEGCQWYDKALSISNAASPYIRMRLLVGTASNAFGQYQFERTTELSEQSLFLAREQQDTWGTGMSLHHLGSVAMVQGDYKRAELLLEEGLIMTHDMKGWNLESIFLDELGQLAQAQGDYVKAKEYYERALLLDQKQGNRWANSYGLLHMALLAYQQNEYDKSRTLLQQSITLASEFNDKRMISGTLELMGMIAIWQDELERAASLIGSAESVLESIGLAFVPEETNIINTLRDQLGEDTFEKRRSEGRVLTMKQAITFACEKSNA
ncbi:MAG: ATP-binding protein, partial [Byssovorax cruenta]